MFHVFIIYSSSTKKFYKSRTENLKNAITRHNNGFEIPTKEGIPWTLVWSAEKESNLDAIKLERKLINLTTNRIVKFILAHKEGIPGTMALDLMEKMQITNP
ncbi:MAG: GIY-YIG nuclease family protein [Bacteroidetes bacterium]|jgi:putative endonuclease|nr:GIY-YIG nuclease family protein [Bacteroidota bacterium]MBT5528888.1 GIY-YIG nuclease family protein [Cytophagia bacterium]MBT3421976.1 GIY-YIG nuclease family protein [Bacteroidota bacterium]MBT3800433.1 GIY-YIG nuclease family protein [Bacteroidota bacterium]MBT3934321.1 GIY-YIG nuclease family protein [Bacteroidota bacterium]